MTAYDEFEYPGQVFPQTHPNRLAVLAALHGLHPAPPQRCRMLEVGCGDAVNLLALALGSPEATFVGFDLAARPVERGRDMAAEIGLTNVHLTCADLMEFQATEPFDYIVAHGFLSWVPPPVQQRLFEFLRTSLAPNGVAFVSYNTYPGFYARKMLGDMMKMHTAGTADPREKVEGARFLARFLLAGRTRDDEFSALLRHEAEWVLNRDSEALLVHDDLAEINAPYWFRDFAGIAAHHGLQFLAEADFHEMNAGFFPSAVAQTLSGMSNIVQREQYIDFLKCRRFRQSLLVHAEAVLDREPKPEAVREFLVSSPIKPESGQVDLAPGVIASFVGPRGGALKIDHALTKAALSVLQASWPRPMSFPELTAAAKQTLGDESNDDEVLAEVLLRMHAAGVADFHLHRPAWATSPGERPVAGPLLRLQLQQGRDNVASLRPINVLLEIPLYRALFALLDGTRDRGALVAELRQLVEVKGVELPSGAAIDQLPALVEEALKKAARDALLTA